MPTIYASCRVSHEDSYKSGVGIDVQVNAIMLWAPYALATLYPDHKWGTVGWRGHRSEGEATTDGFFIDQAVSAYKQKFTFRPAGGRLHSILEKGDVIVFPRLDRAFRNSRDLGNMLHLWDEMGVTVVFLDVNLDTKSPLGRAILTILGAIAQLDSDWKSVRSREVWARLKEQGKPTAVNNRGQRKKKADDGTKYYEPVHYERLECQWIVALHDEHKRSFAVIAEMLEEKRAQLEGRERWPVSPYHGYQNRTWNMETVRKAYHQKKAGKIADPDLALLTRTEREMPTEPAAPIKRAVAGFDPHKPVEMPNTRSEPWRKRA